MIPPKYINFLKLTWTFDFMWKDIAGIMGQTLSPEQRAEITEAAQRFGDDTHLAQPQIYPIGVAAVPTADRPPLEL